MTRRKRYTKVELEWLAVAALLRKFLTMRKQADARS